MSVSRMQRLQNAIEQEDGIPFQVSEEVATRILRAVDEPDVNDPALVFAYRNWHGVEAVRHVLPVGFIYGPTEHHPEPQWILVGHDLDRQGAERHFAFRDILFVGDPLDRVWELFNDVARKAGELVVEVPARDRRIAELLEANNRYLEEGRTARRLVKAKDDALGAILALSSALRSGGPAPEDLGALSANLEEAIEIASAAIDVEAASHQERVGAWLLACFGAVIASDLVERTDRFVEEAIELAQAVGGSRERCQALVNYVFDRPAGDPRQEVGGVRNTLAALCLAMGADSEVEAERELSRVWLKIDEIRAKQAAKPKGSALPA